MICPQQPLIPPLPLLQVFDVVVGLVAMGAGDRLDGSLGRQSRSRIHWCVFRMWPGPSRANGRFNLVLACTGAPRVCMAVGTAVNIQFSFFLLCFVY